MHNDLDVLRQFFAAINRNDMDSMAMHLAEEVTRSEPAGFATAGSYKGVEAVRSCVRKGRDTWAEGSCDAEEFLINGDRIVVYLHARVRLVNSTEWIGGRFADGFVLRDGRILEYRTFWERAAALEWAGIAV